MSPQPCLRRTAAAAWRTPSGQAHEGARRRAAPWAWFAAALVILSGCLGSGDRDPTFPGFGPPGNPAAERYSLTTVNGMTVSNLTGPAFTLEDCVTAGVGILVPYATLRPLVPSAFEIPSFPPGAGYVLARTSQCGAAQNGTQQALTHWFQAAAMVRPRDASWQNDSFDLNYYLLTVATDNEGLRTFADAFNLSADAATIRMLREVLPTGHAVNRIDVQAADWFAGYTMQELLELEPERRVLPIHHWVGHDVIRRIDSYLLQEDPWAFGQGDFEVVGETPLARAMPAVLPYFLDGTDRVADTVYVLGPTFVS